VETLCAAALEQEPGRRAPFLAEACGDDVELRRLAEWLLSEYERAGPSLDTPAWCRPHAEAQASLGPGSRLGPYEVKAFAAAGGMGEIYEARDTRLDRTVAIKVLPPDVRSDPDRRARFEREAKTIAALNHPHICTLHDIGDNEGTTFLVMEHMVGQTLAERMEKGALPLEQALRTATEIAEGLSAAHRQGVIHRDLKPANVMLTESGAKLLDFGLAKLTGHGELPAASKVTTEPMQRPLTSQGVIVGTLQYMAPEQVEGKPADARSDIWALGAILYEMLTGKRAFEGNTAAGLIAAILDGEPEPITSVQPLTPPSLDRVVRTCLEKDPDGRLQAASDVARELRRIASDSAIERAPSGPIRDGRRGSASGRRRVRRFVLTVIVASLVVAAGLLWQSGGWLAPAPARLVHVTTAPGAKGFPALSPDGRQVAYVWSSEDGTNLDIWVKQLGSTESRRLTTDPHRENMPCWSPDGSRIAFQRAGGPGRPPSVFLVTALGGDQQKLREVPSPGSGMAWSPNGRFLAVPRGRPADAPAATSAGIYFHPVPAGDPIRVTSAPVSFTDQYPAFSPDGATLAFVRYSG
jgi:serine/threonine protein kinase